MLTLYEPRLEDLWFRQMMLEDEETMSYNHAWGGTILWPKERWQGWYDEWIIHHQSRRFYRYLQDETGAFIGEIAYHYDDEISGYIADIIVYAKYRGKGYGSQGLDLLLTAARKNGIRVLYDNISIDNPARKLFLKHGFSEEYRTEEIIMLKREL